MIIKTNQFALSQLEMFFFQLGILKVRLLVYTILPVLMLYSDLSTRKGLSISTIVAVTFFFSIVFYLMLSVLTFVSTSKNKAFYMKRSIEIDDLYLHEYMEDGSYCKIHLTQFISILDKKKFYLLLNSASTFYYIRKDSFVDEEHHERFRKEILQKMKENGFIRL
jgi:hypothetical protein